MIEGGEYNECVTINRQLSCLALHIWMSFQYARQKVFQHNGADNVVKIERLHTGTFPNQSSLACQPIDSMI